MTADVELLQAEIEALRAKTAVTMGVGTGDGNLFVHGDYDSIKAAQEIVLERDALRAEVERLREIVRPKREEECLTLDHWRMRAYDLEANWSRCSRACASEQAKRERAEARAEQLVKALRWARDAIEDWAGYASDYFREKHDLAGDLAKIDALLPDQEKDQ